MDLVNLFLWALALMVSGALASLVTAKRRRLTNTLAAAVVMAGCLLVVYVGIMVLVHGPVSRSYQFLVIPGFPALPGLTIDSLSAFFLIIIAFVTIWPTLYSLGYLEHYRHESAVSYQFPFQLFVPGMLAAVAVDDLFYFLIAWEFMTLASYFLVVYQRNSPENLRAGFKYFFMTHAASLGIIIAAVVLGLKAGTFSFQAVPGTFSLLAANNPVLLHLLLALLFLGFATKAGVFPLGSWLPDAHPAAPASVSALLSGVMIKIGVYGILRFFVWLLPVTGSSVVWGYIIASSGVVSMFIGTMLALGQDDCKKLWAFSSIGQIGYIMLGIGLGLVFVQSSPLLAFVAMLGGLYHLLNHAFFKSLLFLNTGSLLVCAGTRDMNKMGGLIRLLPFTAVTALVGCLSIAGLPPFNGFASKWLLYQASIFGGKLSPVIGIFGVTAIFISTVTLAYFIKYFGAAFLGRMPSGLEPASSGKVPATMKAGEAVLAAGCILLGLFPALPVTLITGILRDTPFASAGAGAVVASVGGGLAVNGDKVFQGVFSPVVLALAAAVCLAGSLYIYRLCRAPVREVPAWTCGRVDTPAEMHYRARGYFQPFIKNFSLLYRRIPWPVLKPPEAAARRLDLDVWIYFPTGRGFLEACLRLGKTHTGLAQFYMLWQVLGMAAILWIMYWMMGG